MSLKLCTVLVTEHVMTSMRRSMIHILQRQITLYCPRHTSANHPAMGRVKSNPKQLYQCLLPQVFAHMLRDIQMPKIRMSIMIAPLSLVF